MGSYMALSAAVKSYLWQSLTKHPEISLARQGLHRRLLHMSGRFTCSQCILLQAEDS